MLPPEVAVITNPGAVTRAGEPQYIETTLSKFREIARIKPPGTVDGGDVLMVGNHFFIGISERTNREGASQLGRILEFYGKTWTPVKVGKGLHLKSSVNWVGEDVLLLSAENAAQPEYEAYSQIIVAPDEEYACNSLWINHNLLVPVGFPKTREKLSTLSLKIFELETSEIQKMDGGLTCLSLRF